MMNNKVYDCLNVYFVIASSYTPVSDRLGRNFPAKVPKIK